MKNIAYSILLLLLFSSCEDLLDVKPTNASNIQNMLSSADGMESILNGSYALSRRVYTNYFIHFSEMIANDQEIKFQGTFQEFRDLANKDMVSSFYFGEIAWETAYMAINNVNLIIDNIGSVEEQDEDRLSWIKAQASFLRGLLYFDMIRFYGFPYGPDGMTNADIPLVLKGVSNPTELTYPSKTVNRIVFDQIEQDLLFAYENLPEDESFYASQNSAAAILSRVYLTIEEYQKAADYAGYVIGSDRVGLSSGFFDAFNLTVNSNEDIFTWQQTNLDNEGQNNNGMFAFYASTDEGGRSDMAIRDSFIIATYDSSDSRGGIQYGVEKASKINSMFYEGFGDEADSVLFCSKWLKYNTNITMVRLSEMYLTRAEANKMLNQLPEVVLEDIKKVRSRAGLDVTGLTSITLDEIKEERIKELIFEGHRLHDFKRWERNIGDFKYNAPELIVPIPQKETDANPDLL